MFALLARQHAAAGRWLIHSLAFTLIMYETQIWTFIVSEAVESVGVLSSIYEVDTVTPVSPTVRDDTHLAEVSKH